MCEFDLVEGRKYKVRLKPLEELFSTGVLQRGTQDVPWIEPYLNGCVGVMVFEGDEVVEVDWRDGERVLWCYGLDRLKILGEV